MIPEHDEREIVSRVKAGDTEAFCVLVEKYKHKALNIAYSFCANHEDANDLSQEAFIKAFKTIRGFKGQSKFYTWFYSILVNQCKDYLRKKNHKRFVSFNIKFTPKEADAQTEDIFENIASAQPGPKQLLLNKELGEQLTQAIYSLPERQRTVFTLKNIHGLSIAEIAETIRCAQGTIKAHLFKATINLQNKLGKYRRIFLAGGAP